MSAPPSTDRLVLCRPAPADAGLILRVHRDPAACAHNPEDMITTPAEAVERCRLWRAHWRRHGFGYWVLRRHDGGGFVGFCGVKSMTLHGRPVLNLFYRLAPAAWGAGLATEAATAAVTWAGVTISGDRPVIARVRPANTASARVAVRAGLRRASHLDDGPDEIYLRQQGRTDQTGPQSGS